MKEKNRSIFPFRTCNISKISQCDKRTNYTTKIKQLKMCTINKSRVIQFAFLLLLILCCHGQEEAANDSAGDKFQQCCKEKGVTCPEVCTYPPPDFSFSQQWCIVQCGADFIRCYTGEHNNTKCCSDHGVVGLYGICQDFCDGTVSHSWDPRYMVCGPVKDIISKCNHDSVKPLSFFG